MSMGPGPWSLPSGQDDFVRWLSRWPLGLRSPLLGSLAVSCRVRAHRLMVCACPLAPAPRRLAVAPRCVCPQARLSRVFRCCLDFVACSFAAAYRAAARAHACLLTTPRLRVRLRLAPRSTNASGLAVVAFLASPAGSTPAVPSARACISPTTSSAPPCSCVSTPEGSTFLARMSASPQPHAHGCGAQLCASSVMRHTPALLPRVGKLPTPSPTAPPSSARRRCPRCAVPPSSERGDLSFCRARAVVQTVQQLMAT